MLKKICPAFISLAVILNILYLDVFADEKNKYTECWVLAEATTGTVLEECSSTKKVSSGVMAKLMTVFIAAEENAAGKLAHDDKITVSSNANSKQGAQIWIMPGEEISVSELMKGIIIGNANDAAAAIAEKISGTEDRFVSRMNSRADELGMTDTSFTTADGYYEAEKQISTAVDLSKLVCSMMKYSCFDEYFSCKLDYIRNEETMLVNSNKLTGRYNGLKGYKSGYTDASGYCGAFLAERNDKSYAVVLLGYEDEDKMFEQAVKLLDKGFASYRIYTPEISDELPLNIKVKNGVRNKVRINPGEINDIIIRTGEAENINVVTALPEYIYAPVKKGETVGEIHFYKNNNFALKVEIIAGETVEQNDLHNTVVNLLKKIIGF